MTKQQILDAFGIHNWETIELVFSDRTRDEIVKALIRNHPLITDETEELASAIYEELQ